jgi:hypothetical protein
MPPFYPYISGHTLNYHIGMHVFAVMISHYFAIDPVVVLYFFLPVFLFTLLIGIPAVLFYEIYENLGLSIFFGLSMLAADLSFIKFFFPTGTHKIWSYTFESTIWSLLFVNGIIPSVPLFWGAVLALHRYFKSPNWRPLILFTLLTVYTLLVKSSMGFQLSACAGLIALISSVIYKRKDTLTLLWAALLCLAFGAFKYFPKAGNTEVQIAIWEPFNGLKASAAALGLSIDGIGSFAMMLVIYILGVLGIRIVFLKYLAKIIRGMKTDELTLFLTIFVVSGCLLSELIFIGDPMHLTNNGRWFFQQSLFAASFFSALFIFERKSRWSRTALVTLFTLVSLPTTLNLLMAINTSPYADVTSEQMKAVDYIKEQTSPTAVFAEPTNLTGPSLAAHLAGRQTVISYFFTFVEYAAPRAILDERSHEISDYFAGKLESQGRRRFLAKYQVQYVLAPMTLKSELDGFSELHQVFSSNDTLIYKTEQIESETQKNPI